MLSYQHAYHAGNLADVHKHGLLAWMLAYMTAKDKPLSYLETHAGRGLYQLDAPEAVKTGEAAAGIGTSDTEGWFGPEHPYSRVLDAVRRDHGAAAYAGSPLLAGHSLRPQDRLHLAELHPQEFSALDWVMAPYPARCYQQDGFEMAVSVAPPEPRRGLILIDPSYEIKSDYDTIPKFVTQLHRKWNVGVIVLWYPILTNGAHKNMVADLKAQSLPKVLHHEVSFDPARPGHGMIGSGLFIVNAPFGSEAEADRLNGYFR